MTKIEPAEAADALATLRQYETEAGYLPLLTLGHPEDCRIVRNAAATLDLIAQFMMTDAGQEFNQNILRQAIEGVADSLHLRGFAERAN